MPDIHIEFAIKNTIDVSQFFVIIPEIMLNNIEIINIASKNTSFGLLLKNFFIFFPPA
jgi:hypothetical protein